MDDAAQWYYAEDDGASDPVSLAALRMMLRRGDLLPDDFVFCDGWDEWSPAKDIAILWADVDEEREAPESDKPVEDLLEALIDGSSGRRSDEEVLDLINQTVDTVKEKQWGAWEELEASTQGAVLAMGSLVCGVLCMVGWLSVPGLVAGYYALQRLGKVGREKAWRRIAIGGIVLNVFALILFISSFFVEA